jgi:signal peptidase I
LPKTSQPHTEEIEPRREETLLESLASISTVLVAGLFILSFVFQNFEIPSASMVQTLLIGDHVMADRTTIAPPTSWMPLVHYRAVRRNDIIVFIKPTPESDGEYIPLVKRAVGIPGDRIHLRGGILYVNGVMQNEPYTSKPGDHGDPYDPYRDDFPAIAPDPKDPNMTASWAVDLPNHIQGDDLVVPPGYVFAMGDNRLESLDGRYWGFVPDENIIGRPLFVYWSFKTPEDQENKTGLGDRVAFFFHVAIHFFDGTRWKRTLHLIQ